MFCSERESSYGVSEDALDETPRNSRYRSRRNSDVCVSLAFSDMQQAAFFKGRSEAFINTVMDFFQLETFMEGDFIMREGDIGDKLLFLHRGRVDVLVGPSMVKVASLGHGTVFGEMALLGAPKRTATIRASEFCDCRSLDKHTFHRLLRKFPEERASFELMAKERMEALTQVKEKDTSSFRSASQRRFSSKERTDGLTQAKDKETSHRDSSVRRRSILPPRLEEQAGKPHYPHKPPALSRRPRSSRSSSISSRKTELPSLPSSAISSRTSTAHSLPAMTDCGVDIWRETDEANQVGRQHSRRTSLEPIDYDRAQASFHSCVQRDEMSTGMPPFVDISMLSSLASNSLASPKAGKGAAFDSTSMIQHSENTANASTYTGAPMSQKEIANHKFLLFDHMALQDFAWDMPDLQFTILCTA